MEGPTPISALIHAATMVTAGIFMVARMSPLFEFSDTALSVVLVIGAITALFMGFLGIIQNDIKRVVAYSTLSQLGYMTVALGASAYSVAVFHLMTHAFFKALLFLAAGSVIIGMHHDQDIRNMGGLRKYMPITWITSLIGSLALIGTPFFSGFYSKDSIIEAVHASRLYGAGFAYAAVLIGVFVTAFYSFRMYFLVFHGEERFRHKPFPPEEHDDHGAQETHDDHGHGHDHVHVHDGHGADVDHGDHGTHEVPPDRAEGQGAAAHATKAEPGAHDDGHVHVPHESPWVVTVPLILLAIPSVVIGYVTIGPMLFGNFFRGAIVVFDGQHPAMEELGRDWHDAFAMALHSVTGIVFWLALAGVVVPWFFYMKRPDIPAAIQRRFAWIYKLLDNKYYFDWFNEHILSRGAVLLGRAFWKGGDVGFIDAVVIDGSASLVGRIARSTRAFQSGYLYWYALVMIVGVIGLMTWQLWPFLGNLVGR